MGLFDLNKNGTAQPTAAETQTLYFTETGLPNEDFLNRQTEITQGEYDDLRMALRTADAIYCPFSLRTGEPYLYMDVLQDQEGFGFGKPRIQLWTEQENDRLSPLFAKPDVEVVRIPAGQEGRGIVAFLGMAFYENGAEFAIINGVNFPVAAGDILPKPDFSQIPEPMRPVMNPQLMCWQCLLAQLIGQENPMVHTLDQLYTDCFGKALLSATVLIPLRPEGNHQFSLPAWPGRNGREFVRVFTDLRRLYKEMDPEKQWNSHPETVGHLIRQYDVALNSNNSFRNLGIYIDQAFYEDLSKPV